MGADCRQSTLPTINEIDIIISNEYNQDGFRKIVLVYRHFENDISQFYIINSNSAAYMPFYYVLFFPQRDLGHN